MCTEIGMLVSVPLWEGTMSSIKDVARLAGTSTSTASRVIAKNGPVKAETRERVLKAIEMLDYKPNLLASGLRAKSGRLIGLILPESIHFDFGFFIQSISGICMQYDMGLIIGNHHNDPELESKLFDDFYSRNIDGLIISPASDASLLGKRLKNSLGKVVLIDREIANSNCSSVTLDNYKAGYLIGKFLISKGHRKIACITGPNHISISRDRTIGFRDALKESNYYLDDNFVFEGNFNYDSSTDAIDAFVQKPNFKEITALWAENDVMAVGALKELHKLGFNVPDDIALAGMDGTDISLLSIPSITTISQPFGEMAAKAVDLLLHPVSSEPVKVKFEPVLIPRESTDRIL